MDEHALPAGPFYNRQGEPVSIEEWANLDHTHVADTRVSESVRVSTIFMGVWARDYRPAMIYETVVTGGLFDREGERYATEAEAREGHARWVESARIAEEEIPWLS